MKLHHPTINRRGCRQFILLRESGYYVSQFRDYDEAVAYINKYTRTKYTLKGYATSADGNDYLVFVDVYERGVR